MALSRLPSPGSDDGTWGNILNDFLGVEHNPDGTLKQSTTIQGAQQASQKGQANGYAALDGTTKVPTTQLGGAGADNTKFLRGDQTWTTPSVGAGAITDTNISSSAAIARTKLDTSTQSALTKADNSGGFASGTLASRPAASTAGVSWYFANDDAGGTLYHSDGSTWTAQGPGFNAPGKELAIATNTSDVTIANDAAWHDVTGMQITIPSGAAFILEFTADWLLAQGTSTSGTVIAYQLRALDTATGTVFYLYDNTQIIFPGSSGTMQLPIFLRNSFPTQGSSITIKLQANAPNTANLGTTKISAGLGYKPLMLRAVAR